MPERGVHAGVRGERNSLKYSWTNYHGGGSMAWAIKTMRCTLTPNAEIRVTSCV